MAPNPDRCVRIMWLSETSRVVQAGVGWGRRGGGRSF